MTSRLKKQIAKKRADLERQVNALRSQIQHIDDADRMETNRALVGKCFSYQNRYSSPSETWPLYVKVVGLSEDGQAKTIQFQTDCYGKHEISTDDRAHIGLLRGNGYKPITDAEFALAWVDLLGRIGSLAAFIKITAQ